MTIRAIFVIPYGFEDRLGFHYGHEPMKQPMKFYYRPQDFHMHLSLAYRQSLAAHYNWTHAIMLGLTCGAVVVTLAKLWIWPCD